ncbi:sugar ABC transporter permease [Paenibacillus sp. MWE-103]|uniref:Sugar ABC transporter permease n=1 Tax=Paenibacillus artemisiicola TaxID=1172618 RepID=A0ABS3WFX6_9BACL|nr:sugar ABC transporter permease [Paenibacillus artemisiicola]MBO7747210.1 sugar ABC transporter permease [Paenibacillus artemisiicola]SFJ81250.1 cellobiose transport system permease protein [Paenibacillus sp. UNC496MF]
MGGLLKEIYKSRALYLFISPFYILFLIFSVFPIFYSVYLAGHKWDGIGEMKYVGFDNFTYLFTDPTFWSALVNNIALWIMGNAPQLICALIVAFLINMSIVRFKGFYRIAYFLPNITAMVAVVIIFQSLFGNQYGLINFLLEKIGLSRIEWFNTPFASRVVIAAMICWRYMGYNAIIYLSGLQRIPKDLYEAAELDGASTVQTFLRITLPMLKPIILFSVMMSTIGGFQIFTEPQVLAGTQSPYPGTDTVVLYMFREGFTFQNYGYAAAVSWVLFVIIGILSLINWKVFNKNDD